MQCAMNAESMVVEIKKSENEWALRDKTDAKLKWANTIEWNRSNLFPNINLHSYIIILKNEIVQPIVQNDYLRYQVCITSFTIAICANVSFKWQFINPFRIRTIKISEFQNTRCNLRFCIYIQNLTLTLQMN